MSIQRTMILIWLLALVALTLAAALQYEMQKKDNAEMISSQKTVQVGSSTVVADIADTTLLQTKGLSGRESLAEGEGMLFIFEELGTHSIWMKGMLFSIDIIWAAEDGTIITIEESVSPDTYPQSFRASEPRARYVLEVPAGFTERAGVAEGDKIVVQ